MMLFDRYTRRCTDLIDKFGWMVQGVGDSAGFYAYTVGLTSMMRNELAICGLGYEGSQEILNEAAREHLESPFRRSHEIRLSGSRKFLILEVSTKHMGVGRALYGAMFPPIALQLVWPDENGIYDYGRQTIPT